MENSSELSKKEKSIKIEKTIREIRIKCLNMFKMIIKENKYTHSEYRKRQKMIIAKVCRNRNMDADFIKKIIFCER